ncbi:MAG: glycosyltransferase family 2 protein [Actinomycetota bacterium]|nr:glycosyltransferase family 2 protein [Actinomycetota bacterium]
MALGLLVPAFNEAAKIGAVLDAVPARVAEHDVTVIVVDDGSTDGTAAVAADKGATVHVQPENGGKGLALRRGMDEAGELKLDALVWMDSDGQHRPEDLERIVRPILDGSAAMVVGSRYMSRSRSKAPLNRRLVRQATIEAIRHITGRSLTDPFSGYRAFSPEAVEAIELCGNQYESELEALFCVSRAALPVLEVPIDRIYGPDTSKMGFHRGRILGRMAVMAGYVRTIRAAWSGKDERIRTTID